MLRIPDRFSPLAQQLILNLAEAGKLADPEDTQVILDRKEQIETEYRGWLMANTDVTERR